MLFQSIYNRSAGPERREVGHDPQRAPYAPFVIFGTRPHRIAPKKRRCFAGLAAVRSSLQKWVNHPGYIGDNYMIRAADDSIRQFRAIVDAATKELK